MLTRKFILWAAAMCGLLAIVALVWSLRVGATGGEAKKRSIVVMSSISLQWGEAGIEAIAKGEANPDPLVARLSEFGQLEFVDSIGALQAAQPDIAILIQPKPLSPDENVRLDNWVRAGGRLLLFADPALQWPSDLPFGDPQRPLFTSMLSPILTHWGLELALPMDSSDNLVDVNINGKQVQMVSPGIWQLSESASATGNCKVGGFAQLAECRPGKGQVLLVADADLLNSEIWQSGLPNVDRNDNLKWTSQLVGAVAAGKRVVGLSGK